MESDPARLQPWLGRTEEASDHVALERVRALQATLERPQQPLGAGDPLPPLWHWLFFWGIAPRSGVGRDGHPALGGFLPPLGPARRMWAGSRVRFHQRLVIGEPVARRSTIADIRLKSGRTGQLAFITVRHEISGGAGLAITDEHHIVYREDTGAPAAERPAEPAPGDPAFSARASWPIRSSCSATPRSPSTAIGSTTTGGTPPRSRATAAWSCTARCLRRSWSISPSGPRRTGRSPRSSSAAGAR